MPEIMLGAVGYTDLSSRPLAHTAHRWGECVKPPSVIILA